MSAATGAQRKLAEYCAALITATGRTVSADSRAPGDAWVEQPPLWESPSREPIAEVRVALHPTDGDPAPLLVALHAVGLRAWIIPAAFSHTQSAYVTCYRALYRFFPLPPFPLFPRYATPAAVPSSAVAGGALPTERPAA